MKTINKIIKRSLLGFMYGVFIGQTILILESILAGDGNFYPVSPYLSAHTNTTIAAVIIQYFITGIIGITFAGTTVIFEADSWSLIAQTALHFVITSVVMFFAGFLCGWFPQTVKSTLIWFAVFIVIYIIMWISFTLYYRRKTQKINEAL